MPEGLNLSGVPHKYSYKDKFELFVGDNCEACLGMKRKAELFANKLDMVYKIYDNSKEVPHYPTIKYCEFYIVGNKGFDKLIWAVKAKREGLL
jgi:hypothetical protein